MEDKPSECEKRCPVCGHTEFKKGKMAWQVGLGSTTGIRWIPDSANFMTREFKRNKVWTERCRRCGHIIFFTDGNNTGEE